MGHRGLLCRTAGVLTLLMGLWTGHSTANAQTVLGDEPSYLDLAAGVFDIPIHRGAVTTGEGRVEFRYGGKLFYIGPAVGLLVNGKGGVYGYGGFYADIAFDRLVVTPLAAVGA